MKIKASIPLIRDSFNTYPSDNLDFAIYDETIEITLSCDHQERVLEFSRGEFVKLLKFIKE